MVENGGNALFTEIASPGQGPAEQTWRGRPADPARGSVTQVKIPLLRVVNLRPAEGSGCGGGPRQAAGGVMPGPVLALARLYASQGSRGCPRSPNRPEGSLSLISLNGLHGKTR